MGIAMTNEKTGRDEEKDFYWEGDKIVFTRKYHLARGSCCGSGCRHCPYHPRWTKGSQTAAERQEAAPRTPA